MSYIIKIENLGKKYIIGHQKRQSYQTLSDTMAHIGRGIWQRVCHPLSENRESIDLEEFWALKNINLDVKQGDRIGIIGRNGAGKSTLLKILSRITRPTSGSAHIKGRVASLLEVGTGFHPELTGRENIYLNGAVLGMRKFEIDKKFDEIVAFAEIEKFLDTPVKRYSSGMYVRLAFAVAAHLEPEILLVDEVLAVGDLQFQKKCLGKMQDVSREGRTVLFVSHNMGVISDLCSKVILLKNGELSCSGGTKEIISNYLLETPDSKSQTIDARDLTKPVKITSVEIQGETSASYFAYKEILTIKICIRSQESKDIIIGVGIRDLEGKQILHFSNFDSKVELSLSEGMNNYELQFKNILNDGDYFITVWLGNSLCKQLDYEQNCMRFRVDNSMLGKSLLKGKILHPCHWKKT